MAKNYASIYSSVNDSSALEQAFFIKLETTRGQLIAPIATDFLFTVAGGAIEYTQPIESSPHRSGRHHNDIIKSKKTMSWTIPTLFNIDETLGAPSSAEIDTPVRLLWKSALGKEVTTAGAVYTSAEDPAVTFSMFQMGDKWATQSRGCFVDQATMTFPGDGNSQTEFTGMGAEALLVGIGKSVTANAANAVTLAVGEGKRFPFGCLVMIVKSDGSTRSTDTPSGSPRTVISVAGDVVTVSGAPLADANGTVNPVYLVYYEPPTKTAISNPVTGLVGSVTIAGLSETCVRSATVTIANAHEAVNYCFGYDALHGSYFVPASRMTATVSIEMNLNSEIVEFFNNIQQFEAQDIMLVLGNAAGRHLLVEMPRVIFPIPSISVPETGSIPITFEGTCYQSALDAADEITVSFI